MPNGKCTLLPIALRVYPKPLDQESNPEKKSKRWRRPKGYLIFDTETRTDAAQSLTFGSYRFIREGCCLEEGLFYGDHISNTEKSILEQYVVNRKPTTARGGIPSLQLLTLAQFAEKIFQAAYKSRCLVIGFNLPFDLSRIALDATTARGSFAGGFSLELFKYRDTDGNEKSDKYRPRIRIKHINSKSALKGFTDRKDADPSDYDDDDLSDGTLKKGGIFRGNFLDLRTLAFALTDRGHTLRSACEAFGVENGKTQASAHGVITEEYIDYNRRDVLATAELAVKVLDEYDKHPIKLQETKAYSPASIGKAYLRAMGIKPVLQRQPDFPTRLLGYAQSSFFGGRTSVHIRKTIVPVVHTDFLSMYPTVNGLMGLWSFVIAKEIRAIEHCSEDIKRFLAGISAEKLFNPQTWRGLIAFVKILPDGDILPARAKYSTESNDWQIGINHLHGNSTEQALWFTLPDVVASVLLTGRVPVILDAFRLEPRGVLPNIEPTCLRSAINVDPRSQDFFRVAIEERKRLSKRSYIGETERVKLDKSLKVLANSASYGIYAEMNQKESEDRVEVTCNGLDPKPFTCRVAHPDVPGEYCFPPFASLITGAARLMLALLEHSVTALGGTYAMEDTDSMAIVATEFGGLVPCSGGLLETECGQAAIRALSWNQIKEISDKFVALNPYDRKAIPESVLKIEDVNFDPITRVQRHVYCLAISAKRYTFFLLDDGGVPVLLKKGVNSKDDGWKQHGLGHLLNPTDLESEDRAWIGGVWLNIVRSTLGLSVPKPDFHDMLAVGKVAVTSPAARKPFSKFNAGKPYSDQIKPFNFLLTCQVMPFGAPHGTDAKHFHLIAPFESNPKKWPRMKWIDQYTGSSYSVTTDGHHGSRTSARVKTYVDILNEYEFHPESKGADSSGNVCGKQTLGLLQRRHIQIGSITYIGKESNRLEEVEAGTIHSAEDVYTEYSDPRRDDWQTRILPLLKKIPLAFLVDRSGLSRRALIDIRAGRSRPHLKNQKLLVEIVNGQNGKTSVI